MKKSNVQNTVRISHDPHSFEEIFKGECNGNEFILTYMGRFNAGTEEMETTVNIVWRDSDDPSNAKTLEEGIRKLFRKRLDDRRNKE